MENDYVPAWLVTLLAVFGCGMVIAFISFLVFHADLAAVKEDLAESEVRLTHLRLIEGGLKDRIPELDQNLQVRRTMLRWLKGKDEDARDAIVANLAPSHDEALNAITELYANRERKLKDTLATTEKTRGELIATHQRAVENERENTEERRRLRDQIEEGSRALEIFKRQRLDESLALEQDVKDRERRVQELVDRRDIDVEELIADGRILQAKSEDGFVVIDLGVEDDLRAYTRFQVFNRRAGSNRIKGEIEVIEVNAGMSVARVLSELDANDPIIPGDYLHNVIYNPKETKIFVIRGDFRTFNGREIQRFIEDAGGKVETEITQRTHYLVAGDNAEVALRQAELNGITILSEGQVLDFVRRPERYQLRKGMVFVIAGKLSQVDAGAVESFIRSSGGVIERTVTSSTDVLIAGDGAAEQIAQARLEGALIIQQGQLTHLMNRE